MEIAEKSAVEEYVEALLFGRKLKRAMNSCYGDIRHKYALKQIEIEVLLYYSKYPKAAASDVCRNLDLNKGYVSAALFELCQRGYMASNQNMENRRFVCYSITEIGQQVIDEAKKIQEDVLDRLFSDLTEDELEFLKYTAEKINRNIDNMATC